MFDNEESIGTTPLHPLAGSADRQGAATGSEAPRLVGELGGGKGVGLKVALGTLIGRHGRSGEPVTIDPFAYLEYAKLARSLQPRDTVILQPGSALDPLQVFGPNTAPSV